MNGVVLRTDIERALDEIVAHEEGKRFQALAVVLAKQKYPDLVASEYHKDSHLLPSRKLAHISGMTTFILPLVLLSPEAVSRVRQR